MNPDVKSWLHLALACVGAAVLLGTTVGAAVGALTHLVGEDEEPA